MSQRADEDLDVIIFVLADCFPLWVRRHAATATARRLSRVWPTELIQPLPESKHPRSVCDALGSQCWIGGLAELRQLLQRVVLGVHCLLRAEVC